MKSWITVVAVVCALGIGLHVTGCADLDSSLFNNHALTAYTLPTGVIADSMRTQVVLTSQGKKIYGYFVRSNGAHPDLCILYNHGNKDHIQYYWDRAELLYRTGCNVFIYDYQGYGMSEGTPSEDAIYSDATAAYRYVQSRGFADTAIAVYGFSLGGAPATYLAADVFTPRALVLESAFASTEVLAHSGTLIDIPGSFLMNGTYDNAARIRRVHAPLLMMHGIDDKFIDMETNGKVIFANANDPKQFIAVPGADHSEVPAKMGDSIYVATVRDFVLHAH